MTEQTKTAMVLPHAKLQLDSSAKDLKIASHQVVLPNTAQLLEGADISGVMSKIKLIYRQCGEAQSWAAVSLFEQQVSEATQVARNQALWLEWAAEHSWQLWRIAHELLGPEPSRMALLGEWRRAIAEQKVKLNSERYHPDVDVSPVPLGDLSNWRQRWQDDVLQPVLKHARQRDWDSVFVTPVERITELETGPARRVNLSQTWLSERLNALWQELWQAVDASVTPEKFSDLQLAPGKIAAARGTLEHRCQWQQNLAKDYRIQIPTVGTLESIVATLDGMAPREVEDWQQGLQVWIQSHAPCLDVNVQYVGEPSSA